MTEPDPEIGRRGSKLEIQNSKLELEARNSKPEAQNLGLKT